MPAYTATKKEKKVNTVRPPEIAQVQAKEGRGGGRGEK